MRNIKKQFLDSDKQRAEYISSNNSAKFAPHNYFCYYLKSNQIFFGYICFPIALDSFFLLFFLLFVVPDNCDDDMSYSQFCISSKSPSVSSLKLDSAEIAV